MPFLITVGIEKLRIYAHHGVYDFERKNGGWFEIDCLLRYRRDENETAFGLDNTIDYEKLTAICIEVMKEPELLLETVVTKIVDASRKAFGMAEEIIITLRKMQPPIKVEAESSSVTIVWTV